jgi:hypothetical protein
MLPFVDLNDNDSHLHFIDLRQRAGKKTPGPRTKPSGAGAARRPGWLPRAQRTVLIDHHQASPSLRLKFIEQEGYSWIQTRIIRNPDSGGARHEPDEQCSNQYPLPKQ